MDIKHTYENIYDFYNACDNLLNTGNASMYKEMNERDDPCWVGLSLNDIQNSKYSYDKGLENLKEIEIDSLGGSSIHYKYDEFDGDDINFDRLLDGFPALRKRTQKKGLGTGKNISIYINIAEHCGISKDKFLIKAYATMRIVDALETMGYRTTVYSCVATKNLGKTKIDDKYHEINYQVDVCIKKAEDPLIKGLLLTGISPWFFRYHIFKHMCANHKTYYGLGRPDKIDIKNTKETILIDNGECLTEEDVEKKIKQIKKLYEIKE